MLIGVPKETKAYEARVGLSPASVAELINAGHTVLVERSAGQAIGFDDLQYQRAGAQMVDTATAFAAELVVKVKEPSLAECERLAAGQVLFTFLHLAAAPEQAARLQRRGCTAIAYETVMDDAGRLPLLAPMSEVAGRMAVQVGAGALQHSNGGRGTLLGGVPGVAPGKVVILGGGMAGTNAALMAVGMQADVTIMDKSVDRLRQLNQLFAERATVLMASLDNVAACVRSADLVIGAVLVPGATTPKIINRALLQEMQTGAALVDVSIDQGGCFESSRPTTHDHPLFVDSGVVHYCVTNMPSGVARTATQALNNVTLPYVMALADKGWQRALEDDPGFAHGLNVHAGDIVHPVVAAAVLGDQAA